MADYPRISVVMPAYNAEAYIAESIESVLRQESVSFELVVIDDGSTDATWNVIEKYRADPRVRAFRQGHRGVSETRNELLAHACGSFIAPHDADDVMLPGRLARQLEFLEAHADAGVVVGDTIVLDSTQSPPLQAVRVDDRTARGDYFIPHFCHCASLMRRTAIERAGKYDTLYSIGEDTDMWLRLLEATRVRYLRHYALIRRRNPSGMTQTSRGTPDYLATIDGLTRAAAERRYGKSMQELAFHVGATPIMLRTNSEQLAQTFRAFLALDAPRAPTGEDPSIAISIYELPSTHGIFREVPFSGPASRSAYYAADGGSAVYWRIPMWGALCTFDVRRGEATIYVTGTSKLETYEQVAAFVLYPLRFFLGERGAYVLHAAAVADGDDAVLIVGPAGAGKTTLSLAFAARGYAFLSDDVNFLEMAEGGVRVSAFPRNVHAHKRTLEPFPELQLQAEKFPRSAKGKRVFSIDLLSSAGRGSAAYPRLILFPRYVRSGHARFASCGPEETMARLQEAFLPLITPSPGASLEYIGVLRSCVRHIPAYVCEYSDDNLASVCAFAGRAAAKEIHPVRA